MADKSVIKKIAEKITNRAAYNPLLSSLLASDKKNLFKTNTVSCYHKTGFPLFDYYFGSIVNVHNELGEIISQEPRLGQAAGTFNAIASPSGVGKTTLAVQIAANIIRQFPMATIHHYDFEQRYEITRGENISRLPISDFDDGGRYILKSGAISLEELQEAIIKLYTEKIKNKDELTIETGQVNEFGRAVKVLVPSVILIDSLSQAVTESFSVDNTKEVANAMNMRSNMAGARDAKTLRGFFRDVLPLCKEANIIIYGINHINSNVNTNAFAGPKKQQLFLKADESIPGGAAQFYNAFNYIKMSAKTAENFTEEVDGFNGHMVMFEPVKSSSNQSGNDSKGVSFDMVFSYKHGFDSLRSLIIYGREKGLIEGNKPRLKFVGDPSFTFAFKNLDKEKDEKPIWESIKKFIMPELATHLSFVEPTSNPFDERSMDY